MTGKQTFSGGVFNDRIDGGRAGAEIELRDVGIVARTPDGSEFLVSYAECQVELGGFSGKMVFCRTNDRSLTIFCEDRGFAEALSRASAGVLAEQLGQKQKARRAERRRGRWVAAAVLVGFVGLLAAGFWGIRAGARAAVHAVPISVDQEIGDLAFKSMDLGGPEVEDPVVVQAVQSMLDRLAPHAAMGSRPASVITG